MSEVHATVDHTLASYLHRLIQSEPPTLSKSHLSPVILVMDFPKLNYLQITGDISIEPVIGRIPSDPYPYLYLYV